MLVEAFSVNDIATFSLSQRRWITHQVAGFRMPVPGMGSGSCAAASRPRVMYLQNVATRAKDRAALGAGQASPTGFATSPATIRIGSTRSVSLDTTTATSNSSRNASRTR